MSTGLSSLTSPSNTASNSRDNMCYCKNQFYRIGSRIPSNIPFQDWQLTKSSLCERGQYLLESGLWSDCQFVVGLSPNIKVCIRDEKILDLKEGRALAVPYNRYKDYRTDYLTSFNACFPCHC